MIVTEFYKGQGLGNQLWNYVVLRSLAHSRGLNFGIQNSKNFKGKSIFDLDFGEEIIGGLGPEGGPPISLPNSIKYYLREKARFHKTHPFELTKADPDLLTIQDSTKFDGNCQSLKYLPSDLSLIRAWLKIRPEMVVKTSVTRCVIHIRGGDFLSTHSCLGREYYQNAVNQMKQLSNEMEFVIVTDDCKYSKKMLPNIPIVGSTPNKRIDVHRAPHHIGGDIAEDFRLIYNASYIITSSSTFSFWPAFLNEKSPVVIAPKYWFSHNKSNGWWSPPECIVPFWKYLDRSGVLFSGIECADLAREVDSIPEPPKQNIFKKYSMKINKRLRSM